MSQSHFGLSPPRQYQQSAHIKPAAPLLSFHGVLAFSTMFSTYVNFDYAMLLNRASDVNGAFRGLLRAPGGASYIRKCKTRTPKCPPRLGAAGAGASMCSAFVCIRHLPGHPEGLWNLPNPLVTKRAQNRDQNALTPPKFIADRARIWRGLGVPTRTRKLACFRPPGAPKGPGPEGPISSGSTIEQHRV
jgi:hypothetical protein